MLKKGSKYFEYLLSMRNTMKRHVAVSEKNYKTIADLRRNYGMKDNNTVITAMIERLAEYRREVEELKQRQKRE